MFFVHWEVFCGSLLVAAIIIWSALRYFDSLGFSRKLSVVDLFNIQQDLRAYYWLVDTRPKDEYDAGHIDLAVSIPLGSSAQDAFEALDEANTTGKLKRIVVAYGPRVFDVYSLIKTHPLVAAHAPLHELADFPAYARKYPFMLHRHALYECGRLFPTEVEEGLFLSNFGVASERVVLRALGITHVVNATADHPNCFEGDKELGLHYHRVPVVDSADVDIGVHLEDAVAFIREAVDGGGRVLCHCRHGQSRSATVVAAWLCRRYLLTPKEALLRLVRARPRVSPNRGFLQQLEAFCGQ